METPPRFQTTDPADEILAAFRRDGFVVIDELIAPAFARELLDALRARHPDYFAANLGHFEVGPGRFSAPVEIGGAFADPRLLDNPALTALVDPILGDGWVVEAFGVVVSLPGAEVQRVHADSTLLFELEPLSRMLPTYAVTIALPLIALDALHGMTELWPGTHRTGGALEPDTDGARPEVLPGSAALWDFRVLHRGRANLSDEARPLLYLTLSRPWWTDHRNFPRDGDPRLLVARDTFTQLPKPLRKRLVRAQLTD